jgi:hypothetical protein
MMGNTHCISAHWILLRLSSFGAGRGQCSLSTERLQLHIISLLHYGADMRKRTTLTDTQSFAYDLTHRAKTLCYLA